MAQENQIMKRLYSFKYAFKGIGFMMRTQKNAWIHLSVALLVIVLSIIYKLEKLEWCLMIVAIGLVLMAEMFNTAIEFITDLLSPDYQKKAGRAKDLAAGAVLISAITSALIGLFIFIPKMI
jgi:diacylglycerol kinase (ATP)